MLSTESFGYVQFDFLDLPREGWLARAGQDAVRFASPSEIPPDVICWSNLDWDHFHRGSALGRLGHLRHASYLPIRPQDAMLELGLDPGLLGPDETTRVCALLFGRVMSSASRLLSLGVPGLPEERQFVRGTLKDDFLALFPNLEFPKGDECHALLEGQSYHSVSSTLAPYRKEAVRVVVRRPRLRHARDILASPSPVGPYRFVMGADLGSVHDVVESARPALCRIRLTEADDLVADAYGFANTLNRTKRAARSWACHPELDALRRMARIEMEGGWLGEAYRPLGSMLPEAVDPLLGGRFSRISWSLGLCAEAMWRAALAGPERKRPAKGALASKSPQGDISWQGLWARAADKLLLFPLIRSLMEKGYDVSSYGFGWIFCSVDESRLADFIVDAAALGLLPRIADVPTPLLDVPWGGAKLDLPLAKLTFAKDTDRLLALDSVADVEPERRGDVVASVLGVPVSAEAS